MAESKPAGVSRRDFLIGSGVGATALALGLSQLSCRAEQRPASPFAPKLEIEPIRYGDWSDVWRERWTWDRVVKGSHNRVNCISACSWNLFVKEGIVWREEQNAIYEASRPDVPDFNPRGCQKGACFSELQTASSRVLYPLKRTGERGSGAWKRISWDEALDEIADGMIDAAVESGTESIVHDHGTTNIDFGPDTAGELRYTLALGTTVLDSWAGVGDMPMGAVQTWGMYNCEGTADDWFRSDYIVVWVGNPVYTRIPEVHYMNEARYRGARLVVIAPDYSASAIHADLWVTPKAESDAALGLAMAQVMVSEGLFEADYVREQTDLALLVREDTGRFLRQSDLRANGKDDLVYFWDEAKDRLTQAPGCQGHGGRKLSLDGAKPALDGRHELKLANGEGVWVRPCFERLREHLADYTPEKVARITGVGSSLVRRLAREMAAAPRAMIFASWGSCKHHHSDLFQRAMILLMALTGNQGKAGGGLRVAAWWPIEGFTKMAAAEPHVSWLDIARFAAQAIRGLTPRHYEDIFTKFTELTAVVPLMPFLYAHAGYKELWTRPELADPALSRPFDDYFQEAVERGWIPVHPPLDRPPRVFTFAGSNPLRRWPAPQFAREHLWPKLDLIVATTFRMTTSALMADYVLPCAAYYEKHGVKYAQTYVPYVMVCEKAVEPQGEARPEWWIWGKLTERIQRRARARGVSEVRGPNDQPLDLGGVYDHWSKKGHYDPENVEAALDELLRDTGITGGVGREEAFEIGALRVRHAGGFEPLHQTASDFDPNDTYWPHRWFVEKKLAWPTLTGRQQFYIDHDWYMEAGEAFPVHKDPPAATRGLPLRLTGGHTRWSVHAIWRDLDLMLQLQRGEPACYMSPVDAAPRSILDGDKVRIRNETGAFECRVKVAAGVQPGQVIIYHAWEPFQFPGFRGQQEPVEAPWKPLHLAGGYGQIHYRMYYGAPSHAPRGAPIEVERIET